MADTGKFASTADYLLKVGSACSDTGKTSTTCNNYLSQVESVINGTARYNFSDNYATLNDDTKGLLRDIATNLAAIYGIIYDMSTYDSRIEGEDMINVLRDAAMRGLSILRDKKVQDFINAS